MQFGMILLLVALVTGVTSDAQDASAKLRHRVKIG
jgi:hypothetical protein